MKRCILAVFLLFVSIIMLGCASGPEARGEAAWREAMNAPEGSVTRLVKQREAYIRFREAFYAALERGRGVNPQLLNRYLETAIVRAEFIFGETQSPDAPAVRLIREDIESALKEQGVSAEVRDAYARFLVSVARHHKDEDSEVLRAIRVLEAAKGYAVNTAFVDGVTSEMKSEFGQSQISVAQRSLAEAQRTRDPRDFIRAEYYARKVQHFLPDDPEARRILGITRRELAGFLTAFEAVITEYADTALFRAINSDGVLISVQSVRSARTETVIEVQVHNASFSNFRPEAQMFRAVMTNGDEIEASSVTFERREIVQRHTVAGRLTFRGNLARNNIARIAFQARLGDENSPLVVGNKFLQ